MDRAIRLPDGGFLPAPVFHGKMLEEARPRIADRVLIVDGGSGYLAELVRPLVTSVEAISPTQGAQGEAKLEAADLLLIDGAIEQLPPELVKLVVEDGRVVTGLVEDLHATRRGAVLCTHRPVLPLVFEALDLDDPALAPGEMVVVHLRKGRVVATERHLPH